MSAVSDAGKFNDDACYRLQDARRRAQCTSPRQQPFASRTLGKKRCKSRLQVMQSMLELKSKSMSLCLPRVPDVSRRRDDVCHLQVTRGLGFSQSPGNDSSCCHGTGMRWKAKKQGRLLLSWQGSDGGDASHFPRTLLDSGRG